MTSISGGRAAREAARKRMEEARLNLWLAMSTAKEIAAQASDDGVPDAAIARDLGVSRTMVREMVGKVMSDRFKIHKSDDDSGYWFMDYPHGFTEPGGSIGAVCSSFSVAVATFISAANQQCPQCLRGAVVDTDWGWQCKNCGNYDVAVGKVKRTAPC